MTLLGIRGGGGGEVCASPTEAIALVTKHMRHSTRFKGYLTASAVALVGWEFYDSHVPVLHYPKERIHEAPPCSRGFVRLGESKKSRGFIVAFSIALFDLI